MTFFTGTVGEVIYNMPSAGAAYASATAATVVTANTSSNPPFQVPTPLWQPSYAASRLVKVTLGGTYGCTVSTPTLRLYVALDPTQNSTTSQVVLADTGTVTLAATAITTGNFLMEFYISVTQIGIAAAAYAELVYTNGFMLAGAGNNAAAANTQQSIMVGKPSTTISINPMSTYFMEAWATWGTSSASNTMTCTQFSVFGLN